MKKTPNLLVPLRTKRTLLFSLFTFSLMLCLLLRYVGLESDYASFSDTYNPLSYKNHRVSSVQAVTGKDAVHPLLQSVEPLFDDAKLQQMFNRDINNRCNVFTFFNDGRIRRLSLEEQKFHKQLLRKWSMMYNSLGFKVNILHYNDAVKNPKLKRMVDRKIVYDKENQINENYMKLLAWEQRLEDLQSSTGSFYSDYDIFPVNDLVKLYSLRRSCDRTKSFTLLNDYEFQLMLSDKSSLSSLIDGLIAKNQDFDIFESDEYDNIFAEYNVETWQKLMNTNNVKKLVKEIPNILNTHLKNWKLLDRFDQINIVDPISLGDHYFSRVILQVLKTFIKCEDSIYSPPTKGYILRFIKEILPQLPDKSSLDDDIEAQKASDKILKESMPKIAPSDHLEKCSSKKWDIIISNKFQINRKTLNLVSIPHPLSVLSALKFNEKHTITSEEIINISHRDFLTNFLLDTYFKTETLQNLIKSHGEVMFFNSETLTIDLFNHVMSMFLGFDVETKNDQWGVEYNDESKSFNEVIDEDIHISEGELKRKMDSVRGLVIHFEESDPFVINQRQSDAKLKEYRNKLANWAKELKDIDPDKDGKLDDPRRVLETQNFETRHDPIVHISELWNEKDTRIWWLIKNVRYIDDEEFRLLDDWF